MLTNLLHPILNLHGPIVFLVVGLLVFAEAAILLGFIFPGETAVLLGGVIASEHHISLVWLIVVVVVAAIVGDTVGYFIGEKFGPRILGLPILRKRQRALDSAIGLLRRRGALTVFLARFTAFLRAMIPGLAGMSGMPYTTFLPANVAGGIIWGTGFTLLGFAVGGAYQRVETYAGWASDVLLGLVVVAVVFFAIRSHRKERAYEAEGTPTGEGSPEGPAADTSNSSAEATGERPPIAPAPTEPG